MKTKKIKFTPFNFLLLSLGFILSIVSCEEDDERIYSCVRFVPKAD